MCQEQDVRPRNEQNTRENSDGFSQWNHIQQKGLFCYYLPPLLMRKVPPEVQSKEFSDNEHIPQTINAIK